MLTTIRSGPRRRIAEPAVWLSSTHPWAAQLATAASRRRCRSTSERPLCRVRRATTRPITAAARIPTTTQTQVGVVLGELVLEVVPVVGTILRVVVCSTVERTVDAEAVVVSETVVVTGTVSVVVTSAAPVAAT